MTRLLAGGAAIGTVGLLAVSFAALIALTLADAVGLAPPVGNEDE